MSADLQVSTPPDERSSDEKSESEEKRGKAVSVLSGSFESS